MALIFTTKSACDENADQDPEINFNRASRHGRTSRCMTGKRGRPLRAEASACNSVSEKAKFPSTALFCLANIEPAVFIEPYPRFISPEIGPSVWFHSGFFFPKVEKEKVEHEKEGFSALLNDYKICLQNAGPDIIKTRDSINALSCTAA